MNNEKEKTVADLQQNEILHGNHGFNLYSFVKDNLYDSGWKLAPIVFIASIILYLQSAD
jgi:hypothetical protein